MNLIEQPQLLKKVRDEIKTLIVTPYKDMNPQAPVNIVEILNYDNMMELHYFSMCFNESLRIEPPVTYSSYCFMTEDVKMGKYTLKARD